MPKKIPGTKAAMGAIVEIGGGLIIADIHDLGEVCVVNGNAPLRDNITYGREYSPIGNTPTHTLLDFPKKGFWHEQKSVFVVPTAQLIDHRK